MVVMLTWTLTTVAPFLACLDCVKTTCWVEYDNYWNAAVASEIALVVVCLAVAPFLKFTPMVSVVGFAVAAAYYSEFHSAHFATHLLVVPTLLAEYLYVRRHVK